MLRVKLPLEHRSVCKPTKSSLCTVQSTSTIVPVSHARACISFNAHADSTSSCSNSQIQSLLLISTYSGYSQTLPSHVFSLVTSSPRPVLLKAPVTFQPSDPSIKHPLPLGSQLWQQQYVKAHLCLLSYT